MSSCCQRIMVQVAERAWTREALHRACVLARPKGSQIILVKMIPVQHVAWLGTEFGNLHLTDRDLDQLAECCAIAEDYGVCVSSNIFQYFTLPDAIVQAANHYDADIVFATLPKGPLPFWTAFQIRQMHHHLAREHRVLTSADTPLAAN